MTFPNPLPRSLSPSRLADFQSCPRRFQHASIDRIPQPATYATVKGNFVHSILEHLFSLPARERTIDAARGFIPLAREEELTEQAKVDIDFSPEVEATLLSETETILVRYFAMEDPTRVTSEGVELNIEVTVDEVPLRGILDRLDREEDGSLTIVDYKTGGLPNRDFDAQTFANTELYAALTVAARGETPVRIRLYYVAHGQVIERTVSDVVIAARREAAVKAWRRINDYYTQGEFPATPSRSSCRFCAYKEICKKNGVPVPA